MPSRQPKRWQSVSSIVQIALVGLLCLATVTRATASETLAEPRDDSADFQTEVLLSGLDNPTGILLRPSTAKQGPYELLFAESGVGRIVQLSTATPSKTDEAITGFSVGKLSGGSELSVGPLALGFITPTKLAVTASGKSGTAQVACYTLRRGNAAISAEQTDHTIGPLETGAGGGSDVLGYVGLAIAGKSCFVTSIAEGGRAALLKCDIEANRLRHLQSMAELETLVEGSAPTALVVIPAPRPPFLVVGLNGDHAESEGSRIVYYVPSTGDEALRLPTGLNNIMSLAYSPTGQLYAADFGRDDEQAGGVFRLDDARIDGKQACRAVKIASIVRPFGLAFTPDGNLYVTAFGEGQNQKQGKLVRITGEL